MLGGGLYLTFQEGGEGLCSVYSDLTPISGHREHELGLDPRGFAGRAGTASAEPAGWGRPKVGPQGQKGGRSWVFPPLVVVNSHTHGLVEGAAQPRAPAASSFLFQLGFKGFSSLRWGGRFVAQEATSPPGCLCLLRLLPRVLEKRLFLKR